MNGTIHVAHCPLCTFESEPLDSDAAAREAVRGHLNGHAHGDLVGHVAQDMKVTRYHKENDHGE